MRSFLVFAIFLATLSALADGCGGSNGTTAPGGAPALAISGPAIVPGIGETSQLAATATPAQSSTPNDVSLQSTWSSSNTSVATVSAAGLVTAVSYGTTTIKAVYQGVTAQITFAVSTAGTWVSSPLDSNSNQITWTLSQTGTSVTGAVGFLPGVPSDLAFSTQSVSGSFSGSKLTWTMNLTVSVDTLRPDCVGQTSTFNGTAQVTSSTAMTVTLTGVTAPCDSRQPGAQLKSIGQSATFTKQ